MANYKSYRTIKAAQIPDGTIGLEKLQSGVGPQYCVKHIFGTLAPCTSGCCCQWTVPSGVSRITWELWGAGGNGHGACSCDRCQHYRGASGGTYNTKTISTTSGCAYTVCAAGVYPCCSRECNGCEGCTTYVNGYNLSNFCARGGARGCANGDWSVRCTSENFCCMAPGDFGGDFSMAPHQSNWSGHWDCHCNGSVKHTCQSGAPFLSAGSEHYQDRCWMRCGCWSVPFASGGQGSITSFCGSSCCGQGGTGGSGVVRITYI
jgi:hypothetical protein